MFKLAERRAGRRGLYCGREGLYLGGVTLIEPEEVRDYRVRPTAEVAALLAAAYETPPETGRCVDRLQRVAEHLRAGNLPLALIAAVQLGWPDIEEERLEKLARTDAFLKANFNPAEPRDAHGRWTDDHDPNNGGSRGEIIPVSPSCATAAEAAWTKYPNADFRNRLAEAEGSAKHANFGYGEVNNRSDPKRIALGRYQMTPVALQTTGMVDRGGSWTGKYGIHSQAAFLADPKAQEEALTDYLNDNDRQLRANGAYAHIGETIDGVKARFLVTRAGILAAAHREGAPATSDYLNRVRANGLTSKGLRLRRYDRPIETRLRTFSGAVYE